ncbi:uncharacterized protein LOC135368956 isoform X1 [Ornithodoros turicata]|uniref:uncharacterized protein LOC135368956 isoform X1 n=1 Tax=Ornithodoros turicata TaxID=34597 RepID=UPI00313925AD
MTPAGTSIGSTAATAPSTTTTTPVPNTIGLPQQLLFCVADRVIGGMPDHVCTFLVLSTTDTIFNDCHHSSFQRLLSDAVAAANTIYGVSLKDASVTSSLHVLRTAQNCFKHLWENSIRSFGTLEIMLRPGTTDQSLIDYISFMEELSELRKTYKAADEKGYLFLGIAAIYETGGTDPTTTFKGHFDRLMETKPDILLFRTTDIRALPTHGQKFYTEGPSVWAHSEIQANFHDALRLRASVTVPPGTRELLSVSVAAFKLSYYFIYNGYDGIGARDVNVGSRVGLSTVLCRGGDNYDAFHKEPEHQDKSRIQYMRRAYSVKSMVIHDTDWTLSIKICKSLKEHNFTGGFAVFDVELPQESKEMCDSNPHYKDLQTVKLIELLMTKSWKTCDTFA